MVFNYHRELCVLCGLFRLSRLGVVRFRKWRNYVFRSEKAALPKQNVIYIGCLDNFGDFTVAMAAGLNQEYRLFESGFDASAIEHGF
jgi:hypothetical protein